MLRMAALRALGLVGPEAKAAASVLVGALTDADLRVAELGAVGLLALNEQAAPVMPQIIAALDKPRGKTQETLVELLHNLGPAAKEAIPALTTLQSSNNLELRKRARLALERVQVMPAGEVEKSP